MMDFTDSTSESCPVTTGTDLPALLMDVMTARAAEIRLRHPDSDDPTLQWQTTIVLSEIQGRTRVTLPGWPERPG